MPRAPTTIDFETEPIEAQPAYPPVPVGLAVWEPGRSPLYYAWGHPTGNNCTKTEARRVLRDHYRSDRTLLYHNAPFDVEVALRHFGLPLLSWDKVHCTQVLAFLINPERKRLDLKLLAADILHMPPDEQEKLRDWIIANVPEAKRKRAEWGAYICKAPGEMVAPYGIGDVVRTRKLFDRFVRNEFFLSPRFQRAYERERRMIPLQIKMGCKGIPVNLRKLEKASTTYDEALTKVDNHIRRLTKIKDLEVDSKQDLAYGLVHGGFANEEDFPETPTGKVSVAKDALEQAVTNANMLRILRYRSFLAYNLRTFIRPWLQIGSNNDGYVSVVWNTVRQSKREGRATAGARTGRLSSSPNVQNVSKSPPSVPGLRLRVPPLPFMREYVRAPRGTHIGCADFSQQELRILAHFEEGALMRAYCETPRLDMHQFAADRVSEQMGVTIPRTPMKAIGFGIIYGEGLKLLAKNTGMDVKKVGALRSTYREVFPGIEKIVDGLFHAARTNEPFWTWGDRPYYCEEPIYLADAEGEGQKITFEYKMINTLIQGSAADHIKESMLRYDSDPQREAELLASVHDELLIEAPTRIIKREKLRLERHMRSCEFRVPMLTDASTGKTWAEAKP